MRSLQTRARLMAEEVVEDEDSFLQTVRERYKLCVDADKDNRDRAKEALAFRDLDQWPEEQKKSRSEPGNEGGARPCLVVDKLNQHVHQVVNDERQNRPQIKVRPVDDDADPEVAKIYDGILRHIQDRSHADIAYDTAFECAVDGGFGFWRLLTDYCDEKSFDQDILIKRVRNRFACYLDPERQEPDGSDASYGFLLYKVQRKEFTREFGKKGEDALDSFANEGREFTDWYGDDWIVYAEYFWKETKKETIALLPTGEVVPLAQVPDGIEPLKTRESDVCKIRWRKVTATAILDDGEVVFDHIPIVEVVGNELDIEGKVKRSGMIRAAMDSQRVDNYATSAFVEQVALAPRASWVAAQGQLEGNEELWRTANRRNISVLPYKPISIDGVVVPPPQRTQPPGISQGWLTVMEQSQYNIQAAMGRYNATLGAPSNETSGKAIMNRAREGDTGSYHFTDNLVRSLRHTGQMIVNAIPKVYDTKRVARIIGEDGEPGTANIDPTQKTAYAEVPDATGKIQKIYNLGVGKYDVTVVAGPSYTTRRLEASEFLTQIGQSAKDPVTSQVITYLALKFNDLPGADEATRMIKKLLPQQIIEDEEEADGNKIAQQQRKVQEAIKMIGQREAELNAHAEQLQEVQQQAEQSQQASQQAEQKAKDAMARVTSEVEKLNAIQASIDNDRQLFDLQQKLAAKELSMQSTTLEADRSVLQADARALKAEIAQKQSEIEAANVEQDRQKEAKDAVMAGLEQMQSDLARVAEIAEEAQRNARAERELILDADGEPIGSRIKVGADTLMQ